MELLNRRLHVNIHADHGIILFPNHWLLHKQNLTISKHCIVIHLLFTSNILLRLFLLQNIQNTRPITERASEICPKRLHVQVKLHPLLWRNRYSPIFLQKLYACWKDSSLWRIDRVGLAVPWFLFGCLDSFGNCFCCHLLVVETVCRRCAKPAI